MSNFVLKLVYDGPPVLHTIVLGVSSWEEAEAAARAVVEDRMAMEESWERRNVFFDRRIVSWEVVSA